MPDILLSIAIIVLSAGLFFMTRSVQATNRRVSYLERCLIEARYAARPSPVDLSEAAKLTLTSMGIGKCSIERWFKWDLEMTK
jgi:hypothetical protein